MARCRSCGAEIDWARTEAGKAMPIEHRAGGNLAIDTDLFGQHPVARVVADGTGTHVSHFSTCPQARKWRDR